MRLLALALSYFCIFLPIHAAEPPRGMAVFRSNCAFCHGIEARGGRGPSLVSVRIARNTSDEGLTKIIRSGISGTGMPGFDLEDDELKPLLAYIRQLGSTPITTSVVGDPAHGRDLYNSSACAQCHRIGDSGSIFGPELTRVGSARSSEYLRESIVRPSADIAPEYEGVEVVTLQGRRLTGVRIGEDTFTIQLRLPDQQFALFEKSELQSVHPLDRSLMPAYASLPPSDLNDLVAFLATLQGSAAAAKVLPAPQIH